MSRTLSDLVPAAKGRREQARGLHYDSRKIEPGFVFFAVPGFKDDGAKYIADAFRQGAIAAVVRAGTRVPSEFQDLCVEVPDVRRALAEASCEFFGHPSRGLKIFGITGTKGKTSSAYILDSIFRAGGRKTALLGTVEVRHPGLHRYSEKTTMESLELQEFLAGAKAHGVEAVVMEVSSHALSLDRVWGIEFSGVLFTNLSEDHLDFYGDMENYFQSKKLLFAQPYRRPETIAVTNADEPFGARILNESPGRWLSFGYTAGDFRISKAEVTARYNKFVLDGPGIGPLQLRSRLVGNFSLPNVAGAVVLALASGLGAEPVTRGVAEAYVPGRLDQVETKLPFTVFVDYAHMGHALDNVLSSLRGLCQGRLIVVFGAGGDRPPDRRTQMGAVAARQADLTVITSDNPRSEDPQKIISTIERAFLAAGGKDYRVESDRRAAIRLALESAQAGDVVCIAGKGHESGQIIGAQVFPFNDKVEAEIGLRDLEKKRGVDSIP